MITLKYKEDRQELSKDALEFGKVYKRVNDGVLVIRDRYFHEDCLILINKMDKDIISLCHPNAVKDGKFVEVDLKIDVIPK